MRKLVVAYAGVLVVSAVCAAWILERGQGLTSRAAPHVAAAPASGGGTHSFTLLLGQILLVAAFARAGAAAAKALGQPEVVGEIAAGLALGPSLLGWVLPGFFAAAFPPGSLEPLQLIAQLGIVVFMFLMGLELDLPALRAEAHAAVLVSHTSIVFPFTLGLAASLPLFPAHAPAGAPFTAFALFLGAAMSITAFPVLARILEERALTRTRLGVTALTCAAVDDATAWAMLAVVSAVAGAGSMRGAASTLVLAAAFVALVLGVARPLLARAFGDGPATGRRAFALILFALACALATDLIGIHALFGAFLAGVACPRDAALRKTTRDRLEHFTSTLLVPLFFAFTGLRTRLGLLSEGGAWGVFFLVMAVAVAGKFAGGAAAARWTGMPWPQSLALGALMNTRGLMELVVLNVGFDLGLLSGELFSAMVLMALSTTVMTGPALSLIDRLSPAAGRQAPSASRA